MTAQTGPKRTRIQREYDLKEISDLYLKGWIQADIRSHLAQTRDYEISQQTISNDIKALQKRWLESSLVSFDEAKAQEIEKINHLEMTYWAAYENSKDPTVRRKTVKKVDGAVTEGTQEVIADTGDPRFLQGVLNCIDRRIKLLGLDAPTKREVSGPGGAPIATVDMSSLSEDQLKRLAAGEDPFDVVSD